MKIAIVGPGGNTTIPPKGWGAVEILIYDSAQSLRKAGHDVTIINDSAPSSMVASLNNQSFDIVHIHYDDRIDIAGHINCPNIVITNHYAYIEQPTVWATPGSPQHGWSGIFSAIARSKVDIACLSPGIAAVYQAAGVNNDRLHIIKNGVRNDLFNFTRDPQRSGESIYLAKIDYRKRQHVFQNIDGLCFAGNHADERFRIENPRYLGEWQKDKLYNELTNFANLVLLSDGEAHPLVCMEAMAAGLGLVLSETATANLDLSLPFIDVIPEKDITNIELVSNVIRKNRLKSLQHRDRIREYAVTFSWDNVVNDVYVPMYSSIINLKR